MLFCGTLFYLQPVKAKHPANLGSPTSKGSPTYNHAKPSIRLSSASTAKHGVEIGHPAQPSMKVPHDPTKALAYAVEKNTLSLVKDMISKGADVNARDKDGNTPLITAAILDHTVIAQYLVDHGANVKSQQHDITDSQDTALHWAAYNGNLITTELLLTHGAYVDARNGVGETPFCNAIEEKHFEVAAILLEHKADIDTRDNNDLTPLVNSVVSGEISEVAFLLAHGANLNDKGPAGLTPLWWAAAGSSTAVTQLLIEKGADVNEQTTDGLTAIMVAAGKGNIAEVQLLIGHKADVNLQSLEGVTALMNAARNGNVALVKLLLANGALVDVADTNGNKASDYASASKHPELLPLLGN